MCEPAVIYIRAPPRSPGIDDDLEKNRASGKGGPRKKRFKNNNALPTKTDHETLKDMLENFSKEITQKLDNIERRVDLLDVNYDALQDRLNGISSAISQHSAEKSAVAENDRMFYEVGVGPAIPFSSKVTFITLNREEDFPFGTWLGDPNTQQCRVRCQISPKNLFHIHSICTTAEKMALTLLDYLFDRETMACSNISGTGKHKKKQLDPLLIYGIKCHLTTHFGITERDWHKIKQNIDSKCRSAFLKKKKGLPLNVKSSKVCYSRIEDNSIVIPKSPDGNFDNPAATLENSILDSSLTDHDEPSEGLAFEAIPDESEANILEIAISEVKGDFEILDATPEEIASIQESHPVNL